MQADKWVVIHRLVARRNSYLAEHPRAKTSTACRVVSEKIHALKIERWLSVKVRGCTFALDINEDALSEAARLDGCYVIKTDLHGSVADTQTIHDRYKDLTRIEQAFRRYKTTHLDLCPIFMRSEVSTRGHVLVVMLAFLIWRWLSWAWASLDVTVEEGLDRLKTLCAIDVKFESGGRCLKLPEPRDESLRLLKALGLRLPQVLSKSRARVSTYKRL